MTNADLDHISDLNNLWKEGITVSTFFRNRSVSPEVMRIIKEASGELTEDIERYLDIHAGYVNPVDVPFDESMGGISVRTFWNSTPPFYDTNNLSMVAFFKYGPFKILFPGASKKTDGWRCSNSRHFERSSSTRPCSWHPTTAERTATAGRYSATVTRERS